MNSVLTPTPSWLDVLKSKWPLGKPEGDSRAAAIYLSGSAVATVCGQQSNDDESGQRYSIEMRADHVDSPEGYTRAIANQKASLKLKDEDCHIILAPEFYSLTLVDRPPVAEADVKDAVRWAVQENIDYPMELAELDVFDLPRSASRDSNRDLLFVTVVRKDLITRILGYINENDLNADTIGISELSFRNTIATLFPDADQSIGLVRLTSNSGLINISRSSELFLSRRITGIPGKFSEEAWPDFKDQLLLQVQRSIDYYESAMSQPPCDAIVVATTHSWQDKVCDYLDEMLPVPIRSFAQVLGQRFDLTLHNPEPIQIDWEHFNDDHSNAISAALPAIGGLLRGLRPAVLDDD